MEAGETTLKIGRGARIVILTGAGISKESGLSTFRDADGIWARYDIEEVATPGAFRRNPDLVQDFYNARRRMLLDPAVAPNPAHGALARLEREHRGEVLLVTQNVDDLHERAGSTRLIHMHGELRNIRCTSSGEVFERPGDVARGERCACCGKAGTLRPDVVWFGEMPREMDRIGRELARCDLFIAVGTSGQVYPASGFVEIARRNARAHTVELNLERTDLSILFHETIQGPAGEVVPLFVDRLLSENAR